MVIEFLNFDPAKHKQRYICGNYPAHGDVVLAEKNCSVKGPPSYAPGDVFLIKDVWVQSERDRVLKPDSAKSYLGFSGYDRNHQRGRNISSFRLLFRIQDGKVPDSIPVDIATQAIAVLVEEIGQVEKAIELLKNKPYTTIKINNLNMPVENDYLEPLIELFESKKQMLSVSVLQLICKTAAIFTS